MRHGYPGDAGASSSRGPRLPVSQGRGGRWAACFGFAADRGKSRGWGRGRGRCRSRPSWTVRTVKQSSELYFREIALRTSGNRGLSQAVRQRCCAFNGSSTNAAAKTMTYRRFQPAGYRVNIFCMPIGCNTLAQRRIFRVKQHLCRTAWVCPWFPAGWRHGDCLDLRADAVGVVLVALSWFGIQRLRGRENATTSGSQP